MVLLAALLGWMFDGFEMGLFPMIGSPALQDLLRVPANSVEVSQWFSVIIAVFLVGAATGGVFFGWMGDRIGRVRAMAFSILTYALFTGLCGFAAAPWQVAVLRFLASVGMGGEWSLGVALVNEIWPERSRAWLAGLIGAAANLGFLSVGVLSLFLGGALTGLKSLLLGMDLRESWVASLMAYSAWRLLMISGALPALLVFGIRLLVPESERWQREKEKGSTQHWARRDLLGIVTGGAGACLVIYAWSPALTSAGFRVAGTVVGLVVAVWGFMLPLRQYVRRAELAGAISAGSRKEILRLMVVGAGLAGVALLGTWGSVQWAAKWAYEMAPGTHLHAKEYTQIWLGGGAVVGTMGAALLAGWLGRRITYTLLCLGTMAAALFFYQANQSFGPRFLGSVFVLGGLSAAFYGFFPLYFPELFPTSVRATGQGFAFNFGRVIAAVGSLQTATLIGLFQGDFPRAGSVMSSIYLLGILIIWLGPETKGRPLPA
jgi:MFS family permease